MLVRDANTGEMMEMCLKTGHLLKLGSPPSGATDSMSHVWRMLKVIAEKVVRHSEAKRRRAGAPAAQAYTDGDSVAWVVSTVLGGRMPYQSRDDGHADGL